VRALFSLFRRALPLLLLLIGLFWSARIGKRALGIIVNGARALFTQQELQLISRALEESSDPPSPRDPEGFTEFIRENLSNRSGRDPALDRWEMPFLLERLEPGWYRVRSTGANLEEDEGCELEAFDADRLLQSLGIQEGELDESGDPWVDDDLCEEAEVSGRF